MNLYTKYILTVLPAVLNAAANATGGSSHLKENPSYTVRGNSRGAQCVFPFFHNGTNYTDCVRFNESTPWSSSDNNLTRIKNNERWCSTTDNYTRDGKWGECLDKDVCEQYGDVYGTWIDPTSFAVPALWYSGLEEGWYFCYNVQDNFRFFYCLSNSSWDVSGASADLYVYTCYTVTEKARTVYCKDRRVNYLVPNIERSSCGASFCKNEFCTGYPRCRCYSRLSKSPSGCAGFASKSVVRYSNISNVQNPMLINTMVSAVISSIKPKGPQPNITMQLRENDTENIQFCESVDNSEDLNNCRTIPIYSDDIQCFCYPPTTNDFKEVFVMVSMPVGLVFLSLTLLTFAICRRKLNVNNVVLINLSANLMLTYISILIKAVMKDCGILTGFLHYFFLTAFTWMLIDAVLLFVSAKNLTKLRSSQKEELGWKSLTVIGYVPPLVVVGVSTAVMPDGYNSKECWLQDYRGFFWSFYGPVYCILALNLILFVIILLNIAYALKKLNQPDFQMQASQRFKKKVMLSVLFKTIAQFVILGCPWIAGLISNKMNSFSFVFLVSLQSIFIFLVHCVFNQEVREKCLSIFCRCRNSTDVSSTQNTS